MHLRKKKSFGEYAGSSADSDADSSAESSNEMNDDEKLPDDGAAKVCFEELKYVLVNEQNRRDIETKLRNCREYRKQLMKIEETDLLESFPYFFADPKLVEFMYTILYIFSLHCTC